MIYADSLQYASIRLWTLVVFACHVCYRWRASTYANTLTLTQFLSEFFNMSKIHRCIYFCASVRLTAHRVQRQRWQMYGIRTDAYQSGEKRLHTHQSKTDKFSGKYVRLPLKNNEGFAASWDFICLGNGSTITPTTSNWYKIYISIIFRLKRQKRKRSIWRKSWLQPEKRPRRVNGRTVARVSNYFSRCMYKLYVKRFLINICQKFKFAIPFIWLCACQSKFKWNFGPSHINDITRPKVVDFNFFGVM